MTKVVDFTIGVWGYNFYIDDKKYKTAHGFYSIGGEKINNNDVVFIYDRKHEGAWIARVKKVENCRNPEDMFFCEYKTLKGFEDLKENEKAEIEKCFNNYENR